MILRFVLASLGFPMSKTSPWHRILLRLHMKSGQISRKTCRKKVASILHWQHLSQANRALQLWLPDYLRSPTSSPRCLHMPEVELGHQLANIAQALDTQPTAT